MVEPFKTGDLEERFKYSLFLVLCNRLTSCIIAITMLVVRCARSPSVLQGPAVPVRPARRSSTRSTRPRSLAARSLVDPQSS